MTANPTYRYARSTCIAAALVAMLALALITLIAFPQAASAASATSAHPAGNSGRIYGKLLNGTKRSAPVAGQSVTLQMAQGSNASDLATVKTDAQGTFSFGGLNTDKTINYAVYTLYQQAQYLSDLLNLGSKAVQQVNLAVYTATNSAANLAIVQSTILIDKADPQHGLLNVSENLYFENLGLTTYVGVLKASGKKPNALLFSLPAGARQLSLNAGFDGYNVAQVDTGFATDAAVPPGVSQFAFTFQVPYSQSHYDFSYTALYPTVSLTALLPLDYLASSAVLVSHGTINTNGQTYQQLSAQQILANAQVHVELDGLPASTTGAGSSASSASSSGYPLLIAILLLMLAAVGVTWVLAVRVQRKARKTTPARPARRPSSRSSSASSNTKELRALPEAPVGQDQDALLAELLALDKAREAGTIKKAEYDKRRVELKARLRAIMRDGTQQETSGTVAAAKTSAKQATRSGGKKP